MLNIAIISIFGHMECLGFILESFRNESITIYVTPKTDIHDWISYYQSIYSNITVIVKNELVSLSTSICSQYDKVFCLTYNEIKHDKIIHIVHLLPTSVTTNKLLSLTPYIKGPNIIHTFPIFNPFIEYVSISPTLQPHPRCIWDEASSTSTPHPENIITLIGYFQNNHCDADTDAFIKRNLNYTFYFIVWGDHSYSNLQKHSNVILLNNIPTVEMIDIIKKSKFILSKKFINYDRFSGQLGLAMSFEKPMIIDKQTADNYEIPGIIYQKELSEVELLSEISIETYADIVKKNRVFKQKHINYNSHILYNLA